ncbi:hypothetical protein WICPIJ_009184 [Wickerhamomyces pijperi]|uniref:Uncharacterized protein n=1 Tax=Wickerhamomyces pijperi TaxID=599730 RepID=A0A9P8PRM7_WICPI|nr:hypothetical protein WICPIJ_009184 [Wickerhamomyces pijperi]
MSVDVERMQGSWSGDSLGRHSLDDVTFEDVLLQGLDVCLVAFLANVGGEGLVLLDWLLLWVWDWGRLVEDYSLDLLDFFNGGLVLLLNGFVGVSHFDLDVVDDLESLEHVVECDDRVEQHQRGFW